MILADFNPAILFFLLWGVLSWFTKKKKNQLKEKDQGEYSEMESKTDLFTRLQKLQDHLSTEVDIFSSPPEAVEEGEHFTEVDEHSFEEQEIPKPIPSVVDKTEQYVFKTNIEAPTTEHNNWLKKSFIRKSKLRRLIVLKEILGEPRSLKPYTGGFFNCK